MLTVACELVIPTGRKNGTETVGSPVLLRIGALLVFTEPERTSDLLDSGRAAESSRTFRGGLRAPEPKVPTILVSRCSWLPRPECVRTPLRDAQRRLAAR
jgi:hypothetical protein